MTGAVLDSGALIAYERNDRAVVALIRRAVERDDVLVVPAPVVAQTWRGGRRQVRLARFLSSPTCEVEPLDHTLARMAGQLLARAGTTDVVDAAVVVSARRRRVRVVTSDVDDVRRLDPTVDIAAI